MSIVGAVLALPIIRDGECNATASVVGHYGLVQGQVVVITSGSTRR